MLSVSSKGMPAPGLLRSLCGRSDKDAQLVQQHLQATKISQSDLSDLQANETWPMLAHRIGANLQQNQWKDRINITVTDSVALSNSHSRFQLELEASQSHLLCIYAIFWEMTAGRGANYQRYAQ